MVLIHNKKDGFNRWYDPIYELINKTDSVLELGCGNTNFLKKLKSKGCEVEGVDYYQINPKDGINVSKVDFEKCVLPYKDNSFDVVVTSETIEHLINPYPMLREAKRVLKPNGRLIIGTHNQTNIYCRLFFLFGKINGTFNVSKIYDLTDDYYEFRGHFRVYSKKLLNKTVMRTGFIPYKDHSWFALGDYVTKLPYFLTNLFSNHLLIEYKKE